MCPWPSDHKDGTINGTMSAFLFWASGHWAKLGKLPPAWFMALAISLFPHFHKHQLLLENLGEICQSWAILGFLHHLLTFDLTRQITKWKMGSTVLTMITNQNKQRRGRRSRKAPSQSRTSGKRETEDFGHNVPIKQIILSMTNYVPNLHLSLWDRNGSLRNCRAILSVCLYQAHHED